MPVVRAWSRQSFKVKLTATMISFFLLSIFTVTVFSYSLYTRNFEKQSNERTVQLLDQLSYNIDNYLDGLFQLSLSPYNNLQIIRTLEESPSGTEYERLEKGRLIEDFLDQMIITPRLDILQAYLIADQVYTSGRAIFVQPLDPDFRSQSWYKQALVSQKPIFLPSPEPIPSNPTIKVFSIVKQLRSPKQTDKVLAVIKVDANYSGIERLCERVDMGKRGGLLIVDRAGNTIYSGIRGIDKDDLVHKAQGVGKQQFYLNEGGERYLVASSTIERAGWTILSLNSVKEMNSSATITRNVALLTAAASALLASVVLFMLLQRFIRPLLGIVRLMKEVRMGNMTVRFPDNRSDEIGYLGSSFNEMVSRIDEMMAENNQLAKEVYEMSYLHKEAQLNTLYSQIRPHFIYNTLNTISALVQLNKAADAVETLDKLSLILRNLTQLEKQIRLGREIEFVEAYLRIQHVRYGSRLDYRIEVDPLLHDYLIPPFILQPVIENAIIYCCEESREATLIRVTSSITPIGLTLAVQDNGKGMAEGALERLNAKLASGQIERNGVSPAAAKLGGNGIGLANVNRRIKLFYGEAYGLVIQSSEKEGTRVEFHLPYSDASDPQMNVASALDGSV